MKKIKFISFLILAIAALSIFSYTVKLVNLHPNNMGWYGCFVYRLSNFPEKVIEVSQSNEVHGIPHTFQLADSSLKKVNKLEKSLFILNPFWNRSNDQWEVRLLDLKNDSLVFKWTLNDDYFTASERKYATSAPRAPLIGKNKNLVNFQSDSKNLIRLDSLSKKIWKNVDFTFHHSLNFNSDSTLIFACATKPGFIEDELKNQPEYSFKDDIVTIIDYSNGKTIKTISVIDILLKNQLHGLAFGSNSNNTASDDPIHLNDIEEVSINGNLMKKGDLFLSCRNKSMILHYRPETDSLIRVIQDPFLNQHDIDIQSDSVISLFNNNMVFQEGTKSYKGDLKPSFYTSNSNIVEFNLSSNKFLTRHNEVMNKFELRTSFQGQHEYLASKRLVLEIQNKGIIAVFNENEELILFHTLDNDFEGYIQRPNWIRVYDTINFK